MKIIAILFLGLIACSWADVKGLGGTINFDVQSNGSPEMSLNSKGLGIGTTATSNLEVLGNAIVDQLILGANSGSANLVLSGTLGMSISSISDNTTLDSSYSSIVMADTSLGNVFLTLPYAANVTGRKIQIKKTSPNNSLWIKANGNVIDVHQSVELGSSSSTLPYLSVLSNGEKWLIMDVSGENTEAEDNLIGHWTLDSSPDNMIYERLYNTANSDISPLNFSEGTINESVVFDGTNYISLDYDSRYSPGLSNFSVTAWIKRNGDQANQTGIFKWHHSSEYYIFEISSTQKLQFEMNDGTGGINGTSNSSFPDLTWTHVAWIVDRNADTLYYYINGSGDGSKDISALTQDVAPTAGSFFIGKHAVGGFNGNIDDVRYYNKALSASEVKWIYLQGSGQE